uniref:Photolyase/cryptochrome alpha/beta domain-containing protein n=1 Tax=Timspurckia oligopyrenoides TaxID=708627 RepID=A0A7S1ESG7_9RHOD|mmetsp:Transcript_4103/g.7205  ORF Transcript_4103/g.7205 Transcript_4103/m.7205 type:complete len:413 (+) Transcript_4103:43-1281(+)
MFIYISDISVVAAFERRGDLSNLRTYHECERSTEFTRSNGWNFRVHRRFTVNLSHSQQLTISRVEHSAKSKNDAVLSIPEILFRIDSQFPIPRGLSANVGTNIMWFRNDLRLHDNSALSKACEDSIQSNAMLIPVFIIDPDLLNDKRNSAFAMDALKQLRKSLSNEHNASNLVVRVGHASEQLANIVSEFRVNNVYFQEAHVKRDQKDEHLVLNALRKKDVHIHSKESSNTLFSTSKLIEICDQKSRQMLIESCDGFQKIVEQLQVRVESAISSPAQFPRFPRSCDIGDIPDVEYLENTRKNTNGLYRGGECFGMDRLLSFVHSETRGLGLAQRSASGRIENQFGALNDDLRWGCLSPRFVYSEICKHLPLHSLRRYCAYFDLVLRDFNHISEFIAARSSRSHIRDHNYIVN